MKDAIRLILSMVMETLVKYKNMDEFDREHLEQVAELLRQILE